MVSLSLAPTPMPFREERVPRTLSPLPTEREWVRDRVLTEDREDRGLGVTSVTTAVSQRHAGEGAMADSSCLRRK